MAAPRKPTQVEAWKERLREAGLRATSPRIAVLRVLHSVNAPMSHAEVADELADESFDKATIYRNLVDLAEAGMLRRSDLDHVWRFEAIRDDEDEAGHPHFVCTECGTVACVDKVSLTVAKPARVPRSVRDKQVEVQLRGLCDDCA